MSFHSSSPFAPTSFALFFLFFNQSLISKFLSYVILFRNLLNTYFRFYLSTSWAFFIGTASSPRSSWGAFSEYMKETLSCDKSTKIYTSKWNHGRAIMAWADSSTALSCSSLFLGGLRTNVMQSWVLSWCSPCSFMLYWWVAWIFLFLFLGHFCKIDIALKCNAADAWVYYLGSSMNDFWRNACKWQLWIDKPGKWKIAQVQNNKNKKLTKEIDPFDSKTKEKR